MHIVRTLADAHPFNPSLTTFAYDPLGQLLRSTDPDGYATTYAYDMLGRRVRRNHPDAGTDTYEYDPAGNLTAHTNGNSQTTTYRYDHNQLTEINYPDNPTNNVYYTYGDSLATDNAKGRIILMEDASGWQTFKYGALGEVVENIRTFALPFESQTYTFTMNFEYDSYNRVQKITYPDGEVVSYGYDLGEKLSKVEGSVTRKLSDMIGPVPIGNLQQGGITQPNGVMGGIGGVIGPNYSARWSHRRAYHYLPLSLHRQHHLRQVRTKKRSILWQRHKYSLRV